jgi:cytochrome c biogenesis protein CcdA
METLHQREDAMLRKLISASATFSPAIAAYSGILLLTTSITASAMQNGQTFAEHAVDLIPIAVGLILILGGALVATVVFMFKRLQNSVDGIRSDLNSDYRELDRRLYKVEVRLGVENGKPQGEHNA